jgi:hypothetical protein
MHVCVCACESVCLCLCIWVCAYVWLPREKYYKAVYKLGQKLILLPKCVCVCVITWTICSCGLVM